MDKNPIVCMTSATTTERPCDFTFSQGLVSHCVHPLQLLSYKVGIWLAQGQSINISEFKTLTAA
jgi:hypothetical protein